MNSIILEGGISGWAHAGEEYTNLMDDYHEEIWK
jgi:arsenical-resistance protein 2